LTALCKSLAIFAVATEMLSDSNYPSLALAYIVLESLRFYLGNKDTDPIEETIKSALGEVYEKYMHHPIDSPEHESLLVTATI